MYTERCLWCRVDDKGKVQGWYGFIGPLLAYLHRARCTVLLYLY